MVAKTRGRVDARRSVQRTASGVSWSGMEEPRSREEHEGRDHEGHVDETLLDATLALSVRERLRWNDRAIKAITELRRGFARLRGPADDR